MNWSLASQAEYSAGQGLTFTVGFTAPSAGKHYLLGALFDASLSYISGTLFGVLLPEGSDYAVNSLEYASLWDLEEGEEKELDCRFTFDRSNVILGLFLMKMGGAEPHLDDEQVASLSTMLSLPAPPIALESLLPLVTVVGIGGVALYAALKGE